MLIRLFILILLVFTSALVKPQDNNEVENPLETTAVEEEEDNETDYEETWSDLCRNEYVRCYNNDTSLFEFTKKEFGDQMFDRYKVTNETITLFCEKTYPLMIQCMAPELINQSILPDEIDLYQLFENCSASVKNDTTMDSDEREEIQDFHLTYRHLCLTKVPPRCFYNKQRYCVFERDEEYCSIICGPNTPFKGGSRFLTCNYWIFLSLLALILM